MIKKETPMQCQKIAEKLKQNLPSVSTERRE